MKWRVENSWGEDSGQKGKSVFIILCHLLSEWRIHGEKIVVRRVSQCSSYCAISSRSGEFMGRR